MWQPYELLFCSVELTESSHAPLICIVVINILLAVTAFVGNLLILAALSKNCPLHAPSKLLLRSLTASDLCVGILAEPTFIAYWLSVVLKKINFCLFAHRTIYVTGNMLCAVSILTMTTIAVERLLALTLGLRYVQVVTLKRTSVLLTICWAVSIAGSTLHFVDYAVSLWYGYVACLICLVISTFCYGKIFRTLRLHHRNRVHQQPTQSIQTFQRNAMRYKKALKTALWLQVTFVICYFPYVAVAFITSAASRMSPALFLARQITLTLVFFNSSLNPILYCWKITEIRKSVKETLTKIYHFSN
ncbi:melanocyte-stimulating hormone receptor-like [Montipora foliosa]|uniref:melanocyte-stimulating hormone receptor-like n=1 Tax=Montipora foliosa TaxID=591990 RepID=UPI0035F20C5C